MKRIIQNIILLVLVALVTVGIVWAKGKANAELCTNIKVEIANADSTQFVTQTGVLNEMKRLGFNVVGKQMGQINASEIEEALTRSPYLENVDCVKCQDGLFLVKATQLIPVMRIFDGDRSYYVNRQGKEMTSTASFHADVPIVQGHFSKRYPPTRLLPLVQYVENDTLLKTLVTMYSVTDTNNIIAVPNIAGHVINLGNAYDYESKFEKLKLFYRKVMPQKGWLTYDTISLKWNHQVVATRRIKAMTQELDYNPEDDEQMPDAQTMTIGDDTNNLTPEPPVPKSQKANKNGNTKSSSSEAVSKAPTNNKSENRQTAKPDKDGKKEKDNDQATKMKKK